MARINAVQEAERKLDLQLFADGGSGDPPRLQDQAAIPPNTSKISVTKMQAGALNCALQKKKTPD